ncbi:unnamed protein product [Rhizoctonia solani]|uniref:Uncharacterized protein n=1 Tax=Rhizoctonia solani TaxID=456999 RepID=A0A8H3C1P4_9AGAM|nr:unnamed protein product [Rhizoctonia solani]
MKIFTNYFRFGSQYALKQFRESTSLSEIQNLPVSVDFILVDPEEEEQSSLTDTNDSEDYSPFYTETQAPNIISALRSDTPLPLTCLSGNFLDLRATYPSLPLPMGVSNGTEICINASFKGYFTTLLAPCIWLVLGSYVFVATLAYAFRKSNMLNLIYESSIDDVVTFNAQGALACDTFISETPPLPTAEEVLESTLKQYGHLSDWDNDGATAQPTVSALPPNHKPKHVALDQRTLRNTVRKDVEIMFRGTKPQSWIAREHNLREAHSASWASSVHATALDFIEASMPRVRIPVQSPPTNYIPVQRNNILKPALLHPIEAGAAIRPGTLLLATPKHRPAPIITDTRHLAAMQHQCFNSSPLKYSYTTPSHTPGFQTQASESPTVPIGAMRATRKSSG